MKSSCHGYQTQLYVKYIAAMFSQSFDETLSKPYLSLWLQRKLVATQ